MWAKINSTAAKKRQEIIFYLGREAGQMTGQREILISQAYQITIKALLDHFYLQNQVVSHTAAACQAHCRAMLQPLLPKKGRQYLFQDKS